MNLLDRYLNNVEVGLLLENLDALKAFVRDERSTISNSDFDSLLSRYPNKEPLTIYRGLNFRTKEDYDSFLVDLKDGKLKANSMTSWSPDPKEAESFAKSKMVNDFSQFALSDMESIRNLRKEGIMGYRGVILQTNIDAGMGIDVDTTGVGQESEILLPRGEYDVSIFKEVKKRSEYLDKEEFIRVVNTSENFNDDIEYVLLNKPEFVDKEIFDKLYNYTDPKSIYERTEYVTYIEYYVGVSTPKILSYKDFNKFLDESQKSDLESKFKEATKSFKSGFNMEPNEVIDTVLGATEGDYYRLQFPIIINTKYSELFKNFDKEFWDIVRGFYLDVYKGLNSYEVTKQIKTKPQQELYKRFIVEAIQQLTNLS